MTQSSVSIARLTEMGLSAEAAGDLAHHVEGSMGDKGPADRWRYICRSVLTVDHPFEVHRYVHDVVFESWLDDYGPKPVWFPSQQEVERSNLIHLARCVGVNDYRSLHQWSVARPQKYWEMAIEALGIRFHTPASRVMDLIAGVRSPNWLPGARFNIAASCFQAESDATAIIRAGLSGAIYQQTYGELRQLTNRVSNGLQEAGFVPGDAIAIDMPMTADSVAIYLGIIQMGCVVVSIADSFAAPQIATRLAMSNAKGIITVDHQVRSGKRLPMYEKVVAAGAPRAVVLEGPTSQIMDLRDGDLGWQDFLSDNDGFELHVCGPADDINILFSSGTTGDPKAIPWDHTTPIKCAADGYYHHDIHESDVVAWPTNLGWMMGPWLIFATLINRGTIALFDDVPTERPFGKFVQDAKINMLGLVPSIVRCWRQTGCMEGLDWHHVRAFSSTGECSNPDDMFYLMYLAGYRPVVEYCGGTEIGGGYITSTLVEPNAPSTFSTPTLGIDLVILDEMDTPSDTGEIFLVPPSIGLSGDLLNQDHDQVYYEGVPSGPDGQTLRRHGDHFQRLAGGGYRAQGRVDDTMNLAGIKASSAEIERALQGIGSVKEIAAIACPPPGGGPDWLVIYAVCGDGIQPSGDVLGTAMQNALSQKLNPLFKVHDVVVVDALPRTASQKVMRRELREQYAARQ